MEEKERSLSLVIRATEESQHDDFSNKLRPNSLTAEERQVVKEILLQCVQTRLQKVMQARAGQKPACKQGLQSEDDESLDVVCRGKDRTDRENPSGRDA